jgi:hypothetical protein
MAAATATDDSDRLLEFMGNPKKFQRRNSLRNSCGSMSDSEGVQTWTPSSGLSESVLSESAAVRVRCCPSPLLSESVTSTVRVRCFPSPLLSESADVRVCCCPSPLMLEYVAVRVRSERAPALFVAEASVTDRIQLE